MCCSWCDGEIEEQYDPENESRGTETEREMTDEMKSQEKLQSAPESTFYLWPVNRIDKKIAWHHSSETS